MSNARTLASYASNFPSFRNRIINGDMRIDQRNDGGSVTPTLGQFMVDRWRAAVSQTSKLSAQQNAGSVTPPAGFINYLGITSLSAYSVGTSDFFDIRQPIEGLNIADLAWGTANASTVTLSFWVRSSLTGTFGGALKNKDGTRSYPFSYTVSSANTWEQKSITITGDTTGNWLTNNAISIQVQFGLGAGSTYSGTAGSWASANYVSATGATSVVGTSGATFYITGVQLEEGTVATPFEHRPYGTELALCQRYYEVWSGNGYNGVGSGGCVATNGVDLIYQFLVQKRSSVTATISAAGDFYMAGSNWGVPTTCNSIGFLYSTDKNVFIQARSASTPLTIGQSGVFGSNNTSNAKLNFSAEL